MKTFFTFLSTTLLYLTDMIFTSVSNSFFHVCLRDDNELICCISVFVIIIVVGVNVDQKTHFACDLFVFLTSGLAAVTTCRDQPSCINTVLYLSFQVMSSQKLKTILV